MWGCFSVEVVGTPFCLTRTMDAHYYQEVLEEALCSHVEVIKVSKGMVSLWGTALNPWRGHVSYPLEPHRMSMEQN